jgi:hypothetical protein
VARLKLQATEKDIPEVFKYFNKQKVGCVFIIAESLKLVDLSQAE